jgi:predicted alpha-1,6-mannanase (GH76 family)
MISHTGMRTFLVIFCSLLSSAGALPAAPDLLAPDAVAQRAREGFALLNKLYWSPTLGIWLDRAGDDLRAHYEGRRNPPWWSSANAVETMIDFMHATGAKDYDAQIATLYGLHRDNTARAPRIVAELKRRNQWSDADEQALQRRTAEAAGKKRDPAVTEYYTEFRNEYLDDSGWWGIAWLKMFDHTRDPRYLATARAIHAHMARNWKPEKNGGVMWAEDADKQIPNAITNSLFLILSARLHQRTGEPEFLRCAEKTLVWFHTRALWDGRGIVDAPGHRGDYWSYNQGAFLGGLTALFLTTERAEYLDEAVQVADAILDSSGIVRPDGVLVEKLGTSGWDPGLFKGACIRYFAQLRDVLNARRLHPDTASRLDATIRASAASLLAHGIAEDGQFTIEWHEGAKDRTHNFNTQLSGIAALVATLRAPAP